MSTKSTHIIPHCATQQNIALSTKLSTVNMDLRTYKLVKNGVLSLAVMIFGWQLVVQGADPTFVAGGTFALICLLNGIELGEFYSAWATIRQAQAKATPPKSRTETEAKSKRKPANDSSE